MAKKWTEEDKNILLEEISNDPSNLQQVFRKTAERTGRTRVAVATYWYQVLAPKNRNNRSNTAFMSYNKGSINSNRKISRVDTQQPVAVRKSQKSKWRRILAILFE